MFVVSGVTGNTGSRVAEQLLAQGRKVRVLVRRREAKAAWEEKGAEVRVMDLDDAEALTSALEKAEGAYLLVPPFFGPDILQRQFRTAESIAQAVRNAKPQRTVLLSSIGAQHASGTGPIVVCHHLEKQLAGVAGVTALRAAYFLNNWLMVKEAIVAGQLPSFFPEGKAFPMVSTQDIGDAAVELLTQATPAAPVVELAGPRELRVAEVAEVLEQRLKHKVEALALPTSGVVDAFTAAGVPKELAALYQELYEGVASGIVAREGQSKELLRGTDPVENFFARTL